MENNQEITKYENLVEASLQIGSTTYTGTVEPSVD